MEKSRVLEYFKLKDELFKSLEKCLPKKAIVHNVELLNDVLIVKFKIDGTLGGTCEDHIYLGEFEHKSK